MPTHTQQSMSANASCHDCRFAAWLPSMRMSVCLTCCCVVSCFAFSFFAYYRPKPQQHKHINSQAVRTCTTVNSTGCPEATCLLQNISGSSECCFASRNLLQKDASKVDLPAAAGPQACRNLYHEAKPCNTKQALNRWQKPFGGTVELGAVCLC